MNSEIGNLYGVETITPSEVEQRLTSMLQMGIHQSVLLVGYPGVGKTWIVQNAPKKAWENIYKDMGYKLVTPTDKYSQATTIRDGEIGCIKINIARSSSALIAGIPVPDPETKGIKSYTFDILPNFNKESIRPPVGILFFDEFGGGKNNWEADIVRGMSFEILDGGQSHGFKLPPSFICVGATNPNDGLHSHVTHFISVALLNRVTIWGIKPTLNDFVDWGSKTDEGAIFSRIHPIVLAFCQYEGEKVVFDYEAFEKELVFSSPRVLHRLSTLLGTTIINKKVAEGEKIPSVEALRATFPTEHLDSFQYNLFLQHAQKKPELFKGALCIEDNLPIIKGMMGSPYTEKFIEFVCNANKMLTAEQILFQFDEYEEKIRTDIKLRPDYIAEVSRSVVSLLWEKAVGFENFAKLITLLPSDITSTTMKHLVELFKESKDVPVNQNWLQSKKVKEWLVECNSYPEIRKAFNDIHEVSMKLKRLIEGGSN